CEWSPWSKDNRAVFATSSATLREPHAGRNGGATVRVSSTAPMRPPASLLLPLPLLALIGCVSEHGPFTNRMAQSTTPYLARAAREPVSWQPWERDALAVAARVDTPLLLYVVADDARWRGMLTREV